MILTTEKIWILLKLSVVTYKAYEYMPAGVLE